VKKKSARRIALGGALLAMIVGRTVTPASTQNCEPALAKLRSGERPLVVGGVADFGPFNVVAKDGRLTGMDRDIIRAVAEQLGIKKIEFKVMPFSRLGQSLLDGTIDLIANNFWITPDRERLYAFTRPYYVRGRVGSVWLAEAGPFDSAATMAGKRIATFKGSYPETWAREHVPTATIIPVDGTATELDGTLLSKQADLIVGFYSRKKALVRTGSGDVVYRNALLQPMQAAFAVRKQCEELRQAVDSTLEAMWADGSLNKIKRVYLDPLGIEPSAHP